MSDMINMTYTQRKHQSFFLNDSVAKAIRTYGRVHPSKTIAVCVEEAIIQYIKSHPLEGVSINIELSENIKDKALNTRIEEKILVSEIIRVLKVMDGIRENGKGNYQRFFYELQGLLLKAIKIKCPSDETVALLERAEGYL